MKKTPYQRIMANAKLGKGVYLSAVEVLLMSCDDAILQVALNDDEREEDQKEDEQRSEEQS